MTGVTLSGRACPVFTLHCTWQLRFEILVEFEVRAPLLAHRVDPLHEVGGGIALRLRVCLPPQGRL